MKITVYYLIVCLITTLGSRMFAQDTARYIPITIPTRDGKVLAADLYSLDTTAAKPVILVQTPYNKNYYRIRVGLPEAGGSSFPYDSVHYNCVVVDWRGFYGSKDADVSGYDRGLDGYDAVEWIAYRRWCNGKVGTWGPSALGLIQFQTAKHHPPHLVCSMPLVKDYKIAYSNFYYGGDYLKEHNETMERLGFLPTEFILANPSYNPMWRLLETSSDYPDSIAVPMLLIGGWYDHYPDDVIRAFHDLKARSAPSVRSKHKFIIGPWMHSEIGKSKQGELEYPNAVGISDTAAMRFFDYYLRNMQSGYDQNPTIRYYQMGTDEWRSTSDWYSLGGATDTLYLQSGGLLSRAAPPQSATPDSLRYNPRDPTPSYGGVRFNPFDPSVQGGPLDQRQRVESRSDVLTYTTPVLQNDLMVDGATEVRLYVSSNRKDTDFGVRLCDVYPDGRSMILTAGIRRMRFRNSYSVEDLMTPGQIYPVTTELQNLAMTFLKGHQLRIDVSSSDYPRFDINLNNGGVLYKPGDTLVATNCIYHDASCPSRVLLSTTAITSVKESLPMAPQGYRLERNYPNPFNPATTIRFSLPQREHVTLKVFDVLGREVATLVNEEKNPGNYRVTFDIRSRFAGTFDILSSGVYFYRLSAKGFTETNKMIISK